MWLFLVFWEEPTSILEDASGMQIEVTRAMDKLWMDILDGPVYGSMANLGALFAALTIAISLVQITKELLASEESFVPYERFIWWAMVILLLSNNGSNLARLTLSFRDLVRTTSQMVLSQEVDGRTLEQHWSNSTKQIGTAVALENAQDNCLNIPEPEQREACLDAVQQQVEEQGNDGWWPSVGRAISHSIERIFIALMLAISVAFQWLVEVALILTALLGPIAVGFSLLPVTQKSIYTWLIGFYSVGLCQLCYNLLVAMLAVLQGSVPSANRLIFTVSIGLLSPVLAMVMASGAGMATFSSLAGLAGVVGGKWGGKGLGWAKSGGMAVGRAGAKAAYNRVIRPVSNRIVRFVKK
jgi:hypothetical protein